MVTLTPLQKERKKKGNETKSILEAHMYLGKTWRYIVEIWYVGY